MRRLIISEVKKVFKSKFNIVLMIALLLFSGYRIYEEYQAPLTYGQDYSYQDIDGKAVEGIQYYQKADDVHHQYTGYLSQDLIQRMKKDFEKVASSYQRLNPDVEYMTYLYGKEYETFLANAKNGVYTYEEFYDLLEDMKISGYSLGEENDSKYIKAYFPYYYQEDHILSLYSSLYDGYYAFADTRANDQDIPTIMNFDQFNQLHEVVDDRKSLNSPTKFEEKYSDLEVDENILDYYNQKYLQASNKYDSMIGNTLFVNGLQSLEFATLIILVLVFANTYAMERSNRMDQILIPSKHGWKDITIAKLTSGTCICLSLVFIQVFMVVIASCSTVLLNDLNLVYHKQASISMNYNVLEYVFTYKEIILSGILLMSLAAIVTTLLTIFLSYVTKSRFLTAIPLFLIILLSGSMNIFDLTIPGSNLDVFFPSHMFHFTNFFQLNSTSLVYVQEFFGHMIEMRYVVMVFWAVVMALLVLGMHGYTKKYHIAK